MQKVTVSAAALSQLLDAVCGPSYLIAELRALAKPPFDKENPICILVAEYNAAVDAHNAALAEQTTNQPLYGDQGYTQSDLDAANPSK